MEYGSKLVQMRMPFKLQASTVPTFGLVQPEHGDLVAHPYVCALLKERSTYSEYACPDVREPCSGGYQRCLCISMYSHSWQNRSKLTRCWSIHHAPIPLESIPADATYNK
jgi:hypothetical protein